MARSVASFVHNMINWWIILIGCSIAIWYLLAENRKQQNICVCIIVGPAAGMATVTDSLPVSVRVLD